MIGVKHVEDDVHQLWIKLVSGDHAARPLQHNDSSTCLPCFWGDDLTKYDKDEPGRAAEALRSPSSPLNGQQCIMRTKIWVIASQEFTRTALCPVT